MFHKAIKLNLREGTSLELTFQNGEVKWYDMSVLFDKYPLLKKLKDRDLFTSGHLIGTSGIVWNEELDIEAETIYQDGKTVRIEIVPASLTVASAVYSARHASGLSQVELSKRTGINQADISKIENGTANPSISTLERIAEALNTTLKIEFQDTCVEGEER